MSNRKNRRAEAARGAAERAAPFGLRLMPRAADPAGRWSAMVSQEPIIFARAFDLVTGRDPLAAVAALARLVGRLVEAEAAGESEARRDALCAIACQTLRAGMLAAAEERAELAK